MAVVARSVGVAWLVLLGLVVLARNPGARVAWVVMAAMVWGVAATVLSRARPAFATSVSAVAIDLLVSSVAIVVSNLGPDQDRFAGGLPLVSVAIAAVRGRRSAWTAAGVLLGVVIVSVSGNPSGNIVVDNLSQIIFYGAGAFIFGWTVSVLRRFDEVRAAAESALGEAEARRARAEERAEISRHIHDSVLQTLALIQRQSGRPDEVVTLARSQERELRDWLFGDEHGQPGDFAETLRGQAAEIEDRYRAVIDVVVVGDAALTPPVRAIAAAAREAMLNAAVHAPGAPVAVFAEVVDGTCRVFVRDRGPGFDLAAVASDRGGVRDSIIGRMQGVGGSAELRSTPERGTEWQLEVGT